MKNKLKKGAIYLRQIMLLTALIIFIVNHISSYIHPIPISMSSQTFKKINPVIIIIITLIINIMFIFILIELNKGKHKNHSAKNKRIITKKKNITTNRRS